jgi:phage head maturation protease
MILYGDISKTESVGDGTIRVWGYASSQSIDQDGEVITADAMRTAIPEYMRFGAVREMHDKKAAGTAIEARVEDDGRTWFGAHIVDPIAVKKVEAGVYKGFSVGGRVTARDDTNKAIITGLNLIEVSLVDRPANPDAVFTLFKAADDNLKKWAGEEINDAGTALMALSLISDLLDHEASEPENEGLQLQQLRAAVAALKAFIASEIQEPNDNDEEEEDEGVEMTARSDDLHKVMSDNLARLQGEIAELKKQRVAVDERLKKLEALPQTPKAVLRAVSKSDDIAKSTTQDDVVRKADGSVDEYATALRNTFRMPRKIGSF